MFIGLIFVFHSDRKV